MADFIDRHASESDASDSDDQAGSAKSRSTGDSTDSDDEPMAKKQKKEKLKKRKGSGSSKKEGKKKRKINSSDEEEDEDEDEDEKAKEEMKGFLVDEEDDVEDDNQSNASEKSAKLDSDVDDDDLDLIQENLDIKGVKKKGRVARIDDSDESGDDRDKISKEIFGFGDDDDEPQSSRREPMRADSPDRSGSDSDEGDNFIEYEQDERRGMKQRNRKRKEMNFAEGALDEARDIFGVEDFNFDEFYEEGAEGDVADEEEEYEDDFEGEDRPRARRPRADKVKARETLLDTMEPSELEKGYFAAEDKQIQQKDIPERFQVRHVKVTEASEEEIELEAAWIYAHAFKDRPLTKQDDHTLSVLQNEGLTEEDFTRIDEEAPVRIKETLKFFRNSNFEVPFIGFYRKEGIADLLQINDLWKVYKWDSKWCHLLNRRNKLIALMRRMQTYLDESGEQHHHPLTDPDFYDVEAVQTNESLADVQTQFQLFYGPDLAKMTEWEHQRRLESEAMDEDGEGAERPEGGIVSAKYKQATRKDKYQMCVEYGLGELVARFGLTPKQFAENLDWRRHDVEQDPIDPFVAADDFITTSFPTADDVIKGAQFMLAKQISREPLVRTRMRDHYRRRATISVKPTAKGRETMDDGHPMWRKRYIKEKPIGDLEGDDYLQYHLLRESGVLDVRIEVDKAADVEMKMTLLETVLSEQPFHRDEYSEVAEAWNGLRQQVVEMALKEMLFPELKVELEKKLLEEAKEFVVKRCSETMCNRLSTSSYKPPKKLDGDDDDEENEREGEVRVLGVVYSTERDEVSFGALIDQDGVVIDSIRLPYLMNRRGPQEERQKREDMEKLKRFVNKHQPHVIAVAGENLQARFVKGDMEKIVMDLFQENKLTSNIQVVIHDNDAAKVYMQSKQAVAEHPDYPPNLRQALSLARCLLDPLVEYSHLYNTDEDIFCLSLHPLQADVPKEDLQEAVMLELINRVNEVGVDINKCVEFSHHSGLLQFVCGLGPRKASYLLKTIRQNSSCLESRTKLVTLCKIGPKVFMNCSGFIKIDTVRIQERTDAYVEILDGSRVHPETYEWARKMAVDALEVDDTTDPTAALEEVLQSPERLKDLDLDAFAEELARQGFGSKSLTLYDIRSELFCRYRDLRAEYQEPTQTQLFGMLTKETVNTLYTGKLVTGTVERVVYRRANPEDERAEPIRDENTDMWKCAYCGYRVDGVSKLFEHYNEQDLEKGGCPGSPVGIRLRLDNGLTGFISNKNISDNPTFKSPAERVKLRQVIHARVLKVDPDRWSMDLTCKSSDLRRDDWSEKDNHWDDDTERADKQADVEAIEKKKNAAANQFVKRVISHPNFHNVTYKDAERMLGKLEQGDAIIRPSSKSANNLTVTWKVSDGIYCHVDVAEHEKLNQFTLGKRLVIGGTEEFEDLEEILSRYVQPMASYCREALNHRYAMENTQSEKKDEIDAHLHEMRRENPSKIPYCFTPSAVYPGKFTINYLLGKMRQEYFTPQPDGIRFRKQLFTSLEQMLGWFKVHYREGPAPMYGGGGNRGYR
ncbi:hypothetical protein PMAYCL1PPCAC_13473 [Pristionchus mayeri]|uniref:Suppressor of Ty 6 homolog n=1 Tax=Pristionchus mayeri TaxID=1317129 RepID=A0AAN5C9T0_9BILA|nr:hypothetical protein PMAYCL1PPCAC_13473 [Pristionchus mayeri]